MKNTLRRPRDIFAVMLLLLAFVSGCCTCPKASPPPQVEASPPPDPMMPGVGEWFQERNYFYVTNDLDGVTFYQTIFADYPGDAESAACFISTNPDKDTLTINALLQPLAPNGNRAIAEDWVASANARSLWGFFGFEDDGRQVWFRISLFRPDGQVSADEMDRLINEVTDAMHESGKFFAALEEEGDQILPEENNPHLRPDTRHRGTTLVNYVVPINRPARANPTKPVNYRHAPRRQR